MGDDGRDNADNPGVIAPPPFIYAGALAAGLLANRRFQLPFLPRRLARTLGAALIMGGFAVGLLGISRDAPGRDQRQPVQAGDGRRYRGSLPLHPQPACTRVHA